MKQRYQRQIIFVISLILTNNFFMPTFSVLAQDPKSVQPGSPAEQPAGEAVDAQVAGMTDEQIRRAYSEKLKQDAARKNESGSASYDESSWSDISSKFYGAAQAATVVLKRVGNFFTDYFARPLQDRGLAAIIALGLFFRWLFLRTTSAIQENLINAVRLGKLQFLGRVLARMALETLGICIYVLATFVFFVLFYREGAPNYLVVSIYLIISYYIIVFAFAARVIFSPSAAALRLFPMADRDASFLYKWILRIVIIAGFFAGLSAIFREMGVNPQLYLKMYSSAGIVVILALVIMIWQSRKRVRQAIWKEDADPVSDGHSFRAAFAKKWHYFAIIYVLAAGGIWVAKALNEENVRVLNLIISVFLIPIVIGVDQWVQRLLKIASGEARETIDLSGDASPETDEPERLDGLVGDAAGK